MSLFKKFIANAENIELEFNELKAICLGDVTIIEFTDLAHYETWQDIFGPSKRVVIYWETESNNVGHYTALLYNADLSTIEFFDPYGLNMDSVYKFATFAHRSSGGDNLLKDLLLTASNQKIRINTNTYAFQHESEHINTCGRHCGLRLRFSDLPLNKYIELVRTSNMNADQFVSMLTVMFSKNAKIMI